MSRFLRICILRFKNILIVYSMAHKILFNFFAYEYLKNSEFNPFHFFKKHANHCTLQYIGTLWSKKP